MNANWYDVLDVEPTASAEQIRAAWRTAVADLDPTDRRFRVYNQAAEVLLDPTRRAAYDAELAAADEDTPPTPEPAGAEETPAPITTAPAAAEPSRRDRWRSHLTPRAKEPAAEATAARPEADRNGARPLWTVPGWLLIGLAVLVAASLVLVGVLLTKTSEKALESDTSAAQSAADQAIVPILSYDAHHLGQSSAAATPYMTSNEQQQYDKLFAVIKQNAPRTGTVVRAKFVASGVVRSGVDRVDVLEFVNQVTYNKQHPTTPVVYKNQVTVSMAKVGNSWLVDNLTTNTG